MNITTGGQSFNIDVGVGLNKASKQTAKAELNRFIQEAEKSADVKLNIKINNSGIKTVVKTIKTEMGDLVQVTTQYNKQGAILSQTINKVQRDYARLRQQTEEVKRSQEELNQTVKSSKSIFQDFTDTFMKMAKFNTINLIYDSITNSISEAIEITNEFNRATTELKKVSDLSGESLSEYTEQLSEYGEAVGRTMTEMTDSATIFKRTGSTDEEAAQLAQISELYKNVADSEITSAEASSFLVSQMKAFNYTAEQSIHVIDSVNSVANHFAVSTDDLQTALSKSAAAMATAGNSFEETIALVEAGTAIMQGQAGTVGNGLRTIAINIASLATESDEFVAANGKVNISLKNERGEIRSTYEILNDLAKNWNNLSTAEQNSIAVTLAGKHKYKSLVLPALNLFNCSKCLITL
jgi:TP901 family phage tail tape measure protein